MKWRTNHNLAIRTVGAWWLTIVVAPARAFHYSRDAQSDEHDGFPYTAALEWRRAAESFASKTLAAEYCWRQWERIMRLPRRLAAPVGVSQAAALSAQPSSASREIGSVDGQIFFAKAA